MAQRAQIMKLIVSELGKLETSVTALESQWETLRDDPGRVSHDQAQRAVYLAKLHQWYTIDMPRTKAALVQRINQFWEGEGANSWRTLSKRLLPRLRQEVLGELMSEKNVYEVRCASWLPRCHAACQVWDDLVQLEVEGNHHVYFVGPRC